MSIPYNERIYQPSLPLNDRIIVALDVNDPRNALTIINELDTLVNAYKIGWQLFLACGLFNNNLGSHVLHHLHHLGKRVFLDLKLPNDIDTTIKRVVRLCVQHNIHMLTLSRSTTDTIQHALEERGTSLLPKLLMVPALSTQHETAESSFTLGYAEAAGLDGVVASGSGIGVARAQWPTGIVVGVGIRTDEYPNNDEHKRVATPHAAIKMGADYIVVGRPITQAKDRRGAVQRIVEEVVNVVQ